MCESMLEPRHHKPAQSDSNTGGQCSGPEIQLLNTRPDQSVDTLPGPENQLVDSGSGPEAGPKDTRPGLDMSALETQVRPGIITVSQKHSVEVMNQNVQPQTECSGNSSYSGDMETSLCQTEKQKETSFSLRNSKKEVPKSHAIIRMEKESISPAPRRLHETNPVPPDCKPNPADLQTPARKLSKGEKQFFRMLDLDPVTTRYAPLGKHKSLHSISVQQGGGQQGGVVKKSQAFADQGGDTSMSESKGAMEKSEGGTQQEGTGQRNAQRGGQDGKLGSLDGAQGCSTSISESRGVIEGRKGVLEGIDGRVPAKPGFNTSTSKSKGTVEESNRENISVQGGHEMIHYPETRSSITESETPTSSISHEMNGEPAQLGGDVGKCGIQPTEQHEKQGLNECEAGSIGGQQVNLNAQVSPPRDGNELSNNAVVKSQINGGPPQLYDDILQGHQSITKQVVNERFSSMEQDHQTALKQGVTSGNKISVSNQLTRNVPQILRDQPQIPKEFNPDEPLIPKQLVGNTQFSSTDKDSNTKEILENPSEPMPATEGSPSQPMLSSEGQAEELSRLPMPHVSESENPLRPTVTHEKPPSEPENFSPEQQVPSLSTDITRYEVSSISLEEAGSPTRPECVSERPRDVNSQRSELDSPLQGNLIINVMTYM